MGTGETVEDAEEEAPVVESVAVEDAAPGEPPEEALPRNCLLIM